MIILHSTDSPQDTPSTARPAKGKRFRVAPQGLRNPSTVAYPTTSGAD